MPPRARTQRSNATCATTARCRSGSRATACARCSTRRGSRPRGASARAATSVRRPSFRVLRVSCFVLRAPLCLCDASFLFLFLFLFLFSFSAFVFFASRPSRPLSIFLPPCAPRFVFADPSSLLFYPPSPPPTPLSPPRPRPRPWPSRAPAARRSLDSRLPTPLHPCTPARARARRVQRQAQPRRARGVLRGRARLGQHARQGRRRELRLRGRRRRWRRRGERVRRRVTPSPAPRAAATTRPTRPARLASRRKAQNVRGGGGGGLGGHLHTPVAAICYETTAANTRPMPMPAMPRAPCTLRASRTRPRPRPALRDLSLLIAPPRCLPCTDPRRCIFGISDRSRSSYGYGYGYEYGYGFFS